MILSASLEFEKKYNSEIVERSSDEHEMPQVRNKHLKYIYIIFPILYYNNYLIKMILTWLINQNYPI